MLRQPGPPAPPRGENAPRLGRWGVCHRREGLSSILSLDTQALEHWLRLQGVGRRRFTAATPLCARAGTFAAALFLFIFRGLLFFLCPFSPPSARYRSKPRRALLFVHCSPLARHVREPPGTWDHRRESNRAGLRATRDRGESPAELLRGVIAVEGTQGRLGRDRKGESSKRQDSRRHWASGISLCATVSSIARSGQTAAAKRSIKREIASS